MAVVEKEMYQDEERATLCILLSGFFLSPSDLRTSQFQSFICLFPVCPASTTCVVAAEFNPSFSGNWGVKVEWSQGLLAATSFDFYPTFS